MTRQVGSGLANDTADAVELMFAAAIVGSRATITQQRRRLESEYQRNRCGIDPATLTDWVVQAAKQLPFKAVEADHQPGDHLGDVALLDGNGEQMWIEVKAQTKKNRFADITQSDWIRDASDAMRWLAAFDSEFDRRLTPALRKDLAVRGAPSDYFGTWGFPELVIADIALMPDRSRRERAGVRTPDELRGFLERKYLMHVTREGLRMIRFDHLVPVASWLSGSTIEHEFKDSNSGNVVSVPTACPGPVAHGGTHFTYHLGYNNALGRHKLHAASIGRCDIVVR